MLKKVGFRHKPKEHLSITHQLHKRNKPKKKKKKKRKNELTELRPGLWEGLCRLNQALGATIRFCPECWGVRSSAGGRRSLPLILCSRSVAEWKLRTKLLRPCERAVIMVGLPPRFATSRLHSAWRFASNNDQLPPYPDEPNLQSSKSY